MDIEKKIKYQSKRGFLELDFFLSDFVAKECSKLTKDEKQSLLDLLNIDDMVLLEILQKKHQPYGQYKKIISLIEAFNEKNKDGNFKSIL